MARFRVFLFFKNNMELEYLHNLLTPLIDYPEKLVIERRDDDMGILLTVSVSKPDMGKVIGKLGENAKAIRRILDMYGHQAKVRVSLKINEPELTA